MDEHEIVEQDAPARDIHGQVVDDQQQPRTAALPELEPDDPERGSLTEIDLPLPMLRAFGDEGIECGVRDTGQIFPMKHGLPLFRGVTGLPGRSVAGKSQPQDVMMAHQVFHGALHQSGVERVQHVQQQRLIPVMRTREVLS